MSEYINNQTQRKEALKHVLRQLHAGKTVEEVKEEFAALLQDVGAMDIAQIEQELVEEGMPVEEIKHLCDVHVAVFRASLETQEKPDTVPGHPVYTFLAENGAAGRVLDALAEAISASDWEQAREQLQELRKYEVHYVREENILFPFLEKHGFTGPSSVMWAIHDDVRAGWKKLATLLAGDPDQESVAEVFEPLATAIREMFYKEENILYPAALERLDQEEWAAIRDQEADVGYCYVQPGDQWPPQDVSAGLGTLLGQAEVAAEGRLALKTGALTVPEVNLVLSYLPVDVTYIDKDDAVRFFSESQDRIFQRSGLMREKWFEPRGEGTYGSHTVAKAMARTTEHYKGDGRKARRRAAARVLKPNTAEADQVLQRARKFITELGESDDPDSRVTKLAAAIHRHLRDDG